VNAHLRWVYQQLTKCLLEDETLDLRRKVFERDFEDLLQGPNHHTHLTWYQDRGVAVTVTVI
jgi:hypothetical protein